LGVKESGKFLRGRLDDPNQPKIFQQIAVCAQRYWKRSEGGRPESEATRPGSSLSSKVAYMCVFQIIFRKPSRSLQNSVRRYRCGSSSQIMIAL
jgi:hypothetical protein